MATNVTAKLDELTVAVSSLSHGGEDARQKAMSLCDAIKAELERPDETLLKTFWAQPAHHIAIRIGVEWKLFETLNQDDGAPKTVEQLAPSFGADPELVARMLRHLAAMGTVDEVDIGTFTYNTFSKGLATQPFKDFVTWMWDDFTPVNGKAPEYLKKLHYQTPTDIKNTAFQHALNIPGKDFYEYMAENPAKARQFGGLMSVYASQSKPMWWDEGFYPVKKRLGDTKANDGVLLVDIGGGSGGELAKFQAAYPGLKGRIILQDLPHVVEQSKGLGFEVMAYDWNNPQPIIGARAYILHHILHDFASDDHCRNILRQIIAAMKKRYSKLLIKDVMLPDKGAHWQMTGLGR